MSDQRCSTTWSTTLATTADPDNDAGKEMISEEGEIDEGVRVVDDSTSLGLDEKNASIGGRRDDEFGLGGRRTNSVQASTTIGAPDDDSEMNTLIEVEKDSTTLPVSNTRSTKRKLKVVTVDTSSRPPSVGSTATNSNELNRDDEPSSSLTPIETEAEEARLVDGNKQVKNDVFDSHILRQQQQQPQFYNRPFHHRPEMSSLETLADNVGTILKLIQDSASKHHALHVQLELVSRQKIAEAIELLPQPTQKAILALILNRYASFCETKAVDIPMFPITPVKIAIFLARVLDTPLGFSLRRRLPQPKNYPLPIAERKDQHTILGISEGTVVNAALVKCWVQALAYAQGSTIPIWAPTLPTRDPGLASIAKDAAILEIVQLLEFPAPPLPVADPIAFNSEQPPEPSVESTTTPATTTTTNRRTKKATTTKVPKPRASKAKKTSVESRSKSLSAVATKPRVSAKPTIETLISNHNKMKRPKLSSDKSDNGIEAGSTSTIGEGVECDQSLPHEAIGDPDLPVLQSSAADSIVVATPQISNRLQMGRMGTIDELEKQADLITSSTVPQITSSTVPQASKTPTLSTKPKNVRRTKQNQGQSGKALSDAAANAHDENTWDCMPHAARQAIPIRSQSAQDRSLPMIGVKGVLHQVAKPASLDIKRTVLGNETLNAGRRLSLSAPSPASLAEEIGDYDNRSMSNIQYSSPLQRLGGPVDRIFDRRDALGAGGSATTNNVHGAQMQPASSMENPSSYSLQNPSPRNSYQTLIALPPDVQPFGWFVEARTSRAIPIGAAHAHVVPANYPGGTRGSIASNSMGNAISHALTTPARIASHPYEHYPSMLPPPSFRRMQSPQTSAHSFLPEVFNFGTSQPPPQVSPALDQERQRSFYSAEIPDYHRPLQSVASFEGSGTPGEEETANYPHFLDSAEQTLPSASGSVDTSSTSRGSVELSRMTPSGGSGDVSAPTSVASSFYPNRFTPFHNLRGLGLGIDSPFTSATNTTTTTTATLSTAALSGFDRPRDENPALGYHQDASSPLSLKTFQRPS